MNITYAAYNTAHDFNGGCEQLAPLIGLSPSILRNKVNPHNDHNHLRLDEAVKMMMVTKDMRLMQAIAVELGGVFVKLPQKCIDENEEHCIETLTEVLMCAVAKQGKACVEFQARKADGELCKKDRAALIEDMQGTIEAMQYFIELIKD